MLWDGGDGFSPRSGFVQLILMHFDSQKRQSNSCSNSRNRSFERYSWYQAKIDEMNRRLFRFSSRSAPFCGALRCAGRGMSLQIAENACTMKINLPMHTRRKQHTRPAVFAGSLRAHSASPGKGVNVSCNFDLRRCNRLHYSLVVTRVTRDRSSKLGDCYLSRKTVQLGISLQHLLSSFVADQRNQKINRIFLEPNFINVAGVKLPDRMRQALL